MQLLILVSTELEMSAFADQVALRRNENGYALNTPLGQAEVLISGIGIPATIYSLMRYFQHTKPDLVLQTGYAGSFDRQVGPGSLVEINQDCFADLGLDDNGRFIPIGQAFPDANDYAGWLNYQARTELPVKKGITVNTTSGSKERENMMIKTWQPDVETMEGAAAMWACGQQEIPFAQIRAVSNFTGNRKKAEWNARLAGEAIKEWLINFLELR